MLDIQLIRENTAAVKEAVRRKKFQVDIEKYKANIREYVDEIVSAM